MPDPRLPYLKLTWNRTDVSAFVRVVEVEDDDRLTDRAQIDFEGFVAGATLADQQSVKIELGWQSENAVVFEGFINHVQDVAAADGTHRTRVTALDFSSKMNVKSVPHTWDHGTLTDNIRELVGPYKIRIKTVEADPNPTLTAQHPIAATEQTDLVFLQELGRRYGCRCYVEYNDNESQFFFVSETTLMAAPPAGVLVWCDGGIGHLRSMTYRRGAGLAPPSITATVTNPTSGDAPPVAPDPPATPDAIAVDPAMVSHADPGYVGAIAAAASSTETHADHVPSITAAGLPSSPDRAIQATRRDTTAPLGFSGEGVATGTIMLRAKLLVTIQGIAPWAAGDWYVRRAVHTWRDTTPAGQPRTGAAAHPTASYQTSFAVTR
jgi:hypothetical protein